MNSKRSDVQTSGLYHLSASDWIQFFGVTENTAQKLIAGLSDTAVFEKELELIEKHKIQLLTLADDHYPTLLKEIHSPPIVLYYSGFYQWAPDRNDSGGGVKNKALAIVGARKANEYGQRFVNEIVPDLVSAGYIIVSGGALGIDTMAHEAALACGGNTIAILGSGLLKLYPHQNKSLFKRIIESGGIIASPYPLMMEPLPHNFPARNRIVTGLSQGCLVVQAAKKSGALISAHCALEQGREVFAVPGSFDDELSAGCHEIIQQGAKLVMNSADILSEFGDKVPALRSLGEVGQQQALFTSESNLFSSARPECAEGVYRRMIDVKQQMSLEFAAPFDTPLRGTQGERDIQYAQYSEIQKKIIAACKQPASLEDIMAATQLSFEQVQSELFTLRLDGIVSQDFAGMWKVQ